MDPPQYSPWVGLIYIFNLIVGTGALTLPSAFAKAGWLLSLILIVLLAFVSFVTATFVVETMACANAIKKWQQVRSFRSQDEDDLSSPEESEEIEEAEEHTSIIKTTTFRKHFYNLNTQIELGDMAKMFFNKTGLTCFYITFCVYLYGDLSIYASAISNTIVDLSCSAANDTRNFSVPCWESYNASRLDMYYVYLVVFALTVGPFCYFDLQKTKYLQILTSILRWTAFTIMIVLAFLHIVHHGQEGNPVLVNWVASPSLIGSSVYSFMCHHSIPGLITPFSNKEHISKQLGLDYFIICSFYLLLAFTGIFAFSNLEDLYTLNFIPAVFNQSEWFMETIEYFLGAFPLFTLSTSFPIIAITLQHNLRALFSFHLNAQNFFVRSLFFPSLALLPALFIASCTQNLSALVMFTGSYAGVFIQYLIPAYLVFYARKTCFRDNNLGDNKFTSPFRNSLWILFVIVWAILCVIFVTTNFLIDF